MIQHYLAHRAGLPVLEASYRPIYRLAGLAVRRAGIVPDVLET
jgi:hypothetical protein